MSEPVEPGSAEDLIRRVQEGNAERVAEFFEGMPEKDRRKFVKPLQVHLRTLSWREFSNTTEWQPDRWENFGSYRARQREALLVAGAAAVGGAAGAARWFRGVQRMVGLDEAATGQLVRILADRNPPWLPELADELAVALNPRGSWHIVSAVAQTAGVKPAVTDAYVRVWGQRYQWQRDYDTAADLLGDPRLADFAPLVFDNDENDELFISWSGFHKGLLTAVEKGLVDRGAILDASLRRLLRGGRTGVTQDHLGFWNRLNPTDEEVAERISSCISLLSSQSGKVARIFLAHVKQVGDGALIDLELSLEAASIAVTRQEKNLVRTALGWLDALATTNPDRVGEITGIIATAFSGQAADLQERAVKLIGKRAKVLSAADRDRVVAEAGIYLAPDLVSMLTASLGIAADADVPALGFPEIAPNTARPLLPPIKSPAELAEQAATLMHGDPAEGLVLDRILEAFVEFSRTRPEELKTALTPVVERHLTNWGYLRQNYPQTPRLALYALAEAAVTNEKRHPHRAGVHQLWARVRRNKTTASWWTRKGTSPADILVLRIAEITAALGLPGLPPLVSVPTSPTGLIEPAVLAERLRAAESEGWIPLEADFHQALLRLPRDCDGVDTTGFTSDAGKRFAAWVDGDRIARLPKGAVMEPRLAERVGGHKRFRLQVEGACPEPPRSLLTLIPYVWSDPERVLDNTDWDVCWPAIAPAYPDLAAAALTRGARWSTAEPSPTAAALLAETDDPEHAGLHFLIADRFVDPEAPLRASGVDAALVLASRGLLDGTRVGSALAAIITSGETGGLRKAVPCLRDLANGGAARQTWDAIAELLSAALPPAVPQTLTSTGDLLVLASELADALELRGPIESVTALATKKGSSGATNGARRLDAILRKGNQNGS